MSSVMAAGDKGTVWSSSGTEKRIDIVSQLITDRTMMDHVAAKIFSSLDSLSLAGAMKTCVTWNRFIQDNLNLLENRCRWNPRVLPLFEAPRYLSKVDLSKILSSMHNEEIVNFWLPERCPQILRYHPSSVLVFSERYLILKVTPWYLGGTGELCYRMDREDGSFSPVSLPEWLLRVSPEIYFRDYVRVSFRTLARIDLKTLDVTEDVELDDWASRIVCHPVTKRIDVVHSEAYETSCRIVDKRVATANGDSFDIQVDEFPDFPLDVSFSRVQGGFSTHQARLLLKGSNFLGYSSLEATFDYRCGAAKGAVIFAREEGLLCVSVGYDRATGKIRNRRVELGGLSRKDEALLPCNFLAASLVGGCYLVACSEVSRSASGCCFRVWQIREDRDVADFKREMVFPDCHLFAASQTQDLWVLEKNDNSLITVQFDLGAGG